MAGRALNALAMDKNAGGGPVQVRRLAALAKSSKFVQGGSKAATPVIKALLAVVRSSSTGPKDEQVLLVNPHPKPA